MKKKLSKIKLLDKKEVEKFISKYGTKEEKKSLKKEKK